jgi:beta-galactosidase
VEQYYALEKDFPVAGEWGSGQTSIWAEQLGSLNPDAKVLLRYGKSNGWLDDQPAAVTHTYGKGSITYIGAILDSKLMSAAAEWMVKEAGFHSALFQAPDGVEVSTRTGAGKHLVVLINFAQEPQKVEFGKKMDLLLAGRSSENVQLARYGVEVLEDPK